MQSYQIYKNLAWLNDLPQAEAESVFLACCGSSEWSWRMAEARPFPMLENLFDTADELWLSLSRADRLVAFAANTPIGSDSVISRQTGVADELAEVKRLYEDKFGFIFVLCIGDRSPEEVLALGRARLRNSVETEFRIATEEQRKITQIELSKLLEQ